MILDKENLFDDDAAITVTRDSTNTIDLLRAGQDIGTGENLFVYVTVTTTFVTGDAAVLQIALVTSADAGLGTPTTHQDQVATIAAAALVAGFAIQFRIHPMTTPLRYLGLIYTVTVGSFSAGKVTAGIVKDIQRNTAYPKNYATA